MEFPYVEGLNLHRKKYSLPHDFEGGLNLVFVPFQQWQQQIVDSWIPFSRELETKYPFLRYYELPTIRSMNILSRMFINEGMRAGILDDIARERTITLYLDKRQFRNHLGIPVEDDIYVFLVDQHGNIVWRSHGEFNQEKVGPLIQKLENYHC